MDEPTAYKYFSAERLTTLGENGLTPFHVRYGYEVQGSNDMEKFSHQFADAESQAAKVEGAGEKQSLLADLERLKK